MTQPSAHRIITPGELAIGQFITAYDIKKPDSGFGSDPYEEQAHAQLAHSMQALKGMVYQVLSIALPYIAVRFTGNGNRGVLDTRLLILMEVRKEFVDQLTGDKPSNEDAGDQALMPFGMRAMMEMAEKRENAISELITDLNKKREHLQKMRRQNLYLLIAAGVLLAVNIAVGIF